MNIRVRLGPGLLSANGLPRLTVTLAEDATIDDMLAYLVAQYPVSPFKAAVAVIGGETVSRAMHLSDAQEVALLLPIAGG